MVAGIDFGTANTSVAIFDGKRIQGLPLLHGSLRPALSSRVSLERYFRQIQELLRQQSGSTADTAVIAVPADIGGKYTRMLTEAGTTTGFHRIRFVLQAEAAAVAMDNSLPAKVMVLDTGAGRIEASLLELNNKHVELKRGLSEKPAAENLLTRIEALTEQLLRSSGNRALDIKTVFLRGERSDHPSVRKCLGNIFPETTSIQICPVESAARGALLLFQRKSAAGQGRTAVSPTDIGLEIDWGRSFWMLRKNSPLPASERRIFTTLAENQRRVEVHVIRRSTDNPSRVISLSRIILPKIHPALHGRPKITIQFILHSSGLLTVRVQSSAGNISESMRIIGDESSRAQRDRSRDDIDSLISRVEREYRGRRFFIDPDFSEDINAILELARKEKNSTDPGFKQECSIALWSVLKEIESVAPGREADCAG